jgi:hypothetical protein
MNIIELPESFLQIHPRLRDARVKPPDESFPGTTTVLLEVASVMMNWPQTGEMTGFGQIAESVVGVPTNPNDEPALSGERIVGGVQLSAADFMSIPGAAQFFSKLQDMIFNRYEAQQPPAA